MSDLQNVIAKVKKLLALSTSANANEAATAAALANKLIDQYRLSSEEFTTDETSELDPIEEDDGYLYETGKITPWRSQMALALSYHYGVAIFNDCHYHEGRKFSRYKMVGRKSDIQIVRYMFSWLSLECQRLSNLEARGKGRVFVNSYYEGFVNGVAEQLKASRAEVKATASSQAIVKLDSRYQESYDFMKSNHKLGSNKNTSYRQIDRNAFDRGTQQGKGVHMGAALGGNGKVRLLGS